MSKLTEKFNAQALLKDLNDAATAQIATLQDAGKGAAQTVVSTAKDAFKMARSAKKLAKALEIPHRGAVNNDLFVKLAQKATEKGVEGADRLKKIMDWNKNFWSMPEVRAADKLSWNPIKSARIIKKLAQKQPKP